MIWSVSTLARSMAATRPVCVVKGFMYVLFIEPSLREYTDRGPEDSELLTS